MSGSDPRRGPDPTPIIRLTTAYWDSQTFLTACRLRVFDLLAGGARSADSLADDVGRGVLPVRVHRDHAGAVGVGQVAVVEAGLERPPLALVDGVVDGLHAAVGRSGGWQPSKPIAARPVRPPADRR